MPSVPKTSRSNQKYLILDYETRSAADLRKVGASEYARHPSTEIICCAWRLGTKESLKKETTHLWVYDDDGEFFLSNEWSDFTEALLDPATKLVAHNAFFEQVITYFVLAERVLLGHQRLQSLIPPGRWICTAAMAAALALPRKLEGAAKALGLPVQKDMEGHRLMLKHSKPRKPSKKYPKGGWHSDPEERQKIYNYCMSDIAVEAELFTKLPELNAFERKIWVLDQKINHRGILVDRGLVSAAQEMIEQESNNINLRCAELTGGLSVNKAQALRSWLYGQGLVLHDLQQKTLASVIKNGEAQGNVLEVVKLRALGAKTSTAKYKAFDLRSRSDGRLRDILVYHAASTGRWGGSGVQLQNLPRASIKDTDGAAELIKEGNLELLHMLYGSPLEVLSSCLRSVLVAPEGKIFDIADYAGIEARVLFWVAKHEAGLNAFREGRDLYRELAATIFDIPTTEVDSKQRFVGKTAILGAGYGMGPVKFVGTCAAQGQEVSDSLAESAIAAYRCDHYPVVQLWNNVNLAAIKAVESKDQKITVNRTSWWYANNFLWCQLPSGRRLAYHKPSVVVEKNRWGITGPVLYHYGTNAVTKQWERQSTYGGRLVENVVQAIARDLLAEAMLRIEATGVWEIPLHVHDELIGEREEFEGSIEEFCNLMAELPKWAEGLPVKVEGWSGRRYRK